jgi:hypothetical protein
MTSQAQFRPVQDMPEKDRLGRMTNTSTTSASPSSTISAMCAASPTF